MKKGNKKAKNRGLCLKRPQNDPVGSNPEDLWLFRHLIRVKLIRDMTYLHTKLYFSKLIFSNCIFSNSIGHGTIIEIITSILLSAQWRSWLLVNCDHILQARATKWIATTFQRASSQIKTANGSFCPILTHFDWYWQILAHLGWYDLFFGHILHLVHFSSDQNISCMLKCIQTFWVANITSCRIQRFLRILYLIQQLHMGC